MQAGQSTPVLVSPAGVWMAAYVAPEFLHKWCPHRCARFYHDMGTDMSPYHDRRWLLYPTLKTAWSFLLVGPEKCDSCLVQKPVLNVDSSQKKMHFYYLSQIRTSPKTQYWLSWLRIDSVLRLYPHLGFWGCSDEWFGITKALPKLMSFRISISIFGVIKSNLQFITFYTTGQLRLRVKFLAQGSRSGSLVDLVFRLTTLWSIVQHLNLNQHLWSYVPRFDRVTYCILWLAQNPISLESCSQNAVVYMCKLSWFILTDEGLGLAWRLHVYTITWVKTCLTSTGVISTM